MEENNARNTYYFLPLILALIGMVFHYKKDSESFYAVLLFFIFTGIGIIAYTNAKPFEPRERHYVFAVSFWAFSIWMGLGVLGSYDYLKQKLPKVNKKGYFSCSYIYLEFGCSCNISKRKLGRPR